jgi:hypothetical protein
MHRGSAWHSSRDWCYIATFRGNKITNIPGIKHEREQVPMMEDKGIEPQWDVPTGILGV